MPYEPKLKPFPAMLRIWYNRARRLYCAQALDTSRNQIGSVSWGNSRDDARAELAYSMFELATNKAANDQMLARLWMLRAVRVGVRVLRGDE